MFTVFTVYVYESSYCDYMGNLQLCVIIYKNNSGPHGPDQNLTQTLIKIILQNLNPTPKLDHSVTKPVQWQCLILVDVSYLELKPLCSTFIYIFYDNDTVADNKHCIALY